MITRGVKNVRLGPTEREQREMVSTEDWPHAGRESDTPAEPTMDRLELFFLLRDNLAHCNSLMRDIQAGGESALRTAPLMARATKRLAATAELFNEHRAKD